LNKIDIEIDKVKSRLKQLNRKIKFIDLLKGLLLLVLVAFVINITLPTLELLGLNSVKDRTILFFAGVVVFVFAFIVLLVIPMANLFKSTEKKDFNNLAQFVGKHFSEIDDKLLNTIQLYEDTHKSELAKAAIFSQLEKTEKYNFNSVISFGVLKQTALIASMSVIAVVILFSSFPSLRYSTIKTLNYSKEYIIPQKYQFYIEPENTTVTKGERVLIKASVIGGSPSFISLFIKDKENQSYQKTTLTPDSNDVFTYSINSIANTTKYFVQVEDIKSNEFIITVIDKPIISRLELKITPPRYSKLESTIQKDNGNVFALVGSKINMNVVSNKELKNGSVLFSDSIKKKININQNIGKIDFQILKDKNYKIIIVDVNGNSNDNPIEYTIKSKLDLFPEIEIIQPEGDIILTKAELVNTEIKIKDDFGFRKLTLNHKLTTTSFGIAEENYSKIIIPLRENEANQNVFYAWSLSNMMLASGDIISFYFEVFDNDNISGPKSAKSNVFQLRVPTMEELFKNAEVVQEEAQVDLEETLKEAEKLKEDMKKLSNELKKDDKEITWDEKKKIEETAERFEKLQNQIEEAQKKIDETKKNLDDNNLLSKETLEKYNELQKLMDDMNSEDMKNAMEQLQKQMENMNRDKAQQSLDDMKFDEEMFKKSIERTVNLLKRIQIEQKMDEVIKRTEELQKEIDELKKETEKSDLSNESEKNDLTKKKEKTTKQFEQLKKEMEKLQDKMSEFKEMPNDKMDELQKEMESQKNEELSKKMDEMLQQNMKMEAMDQMQQLSQNMEQMKNQMQQVQEQMQQQNQMQVLFEMMKGINNLLSLSKEEEALKNSMEKSNPNSKQNLENLQKQKEISDGLDKTLKSMSELSQKTFAITPEMGKALGNANKEMNSAMQAMQNNNSSMAMAGQTGAMKYLNEAASMMKGNMEQMMNGGGQGGGMPSMMQQMQQMSQQQMGLNQLTQQLKQGGKLTPQQQAGMQRLSQQQEMIRKSLEELNKESKERGDSKTLTSNLEKILEEMREVITNMNTDKIDDDLIQSQNKILSKLLDAQRSINERDFEKNRESNSSKNFNRKSPEELKLNSEMNKIKDELMKIINEGYSKDYEELIKKYYEILEEENKKDRSN
jgi:hypothetical protein